jgi:hypothetical protein
MSVNGDLDLAFFVAFINLAMVMGKAFFVFLRCALINMWAVHSGWFGSDDRVVAVRGVRGWCF